MCAVSVMRWLCIRMQCFELVRAGQVLSGDGRDGNDIVGDSRDAYAGRRW